VDARGEWEIWGLDWGLDWGWCDRVVSFVLKGKPERLLGARDE
jgi:hypothetical protein